MVEERHREYIEQVRTKKQYDKHRPSSCVCCSKSEIDQCAYCAGTGVRFWDDDLTNECWLCPNCRIKCVNYKGIAALRSKLSES